MTPPADPPGTGAGRQRTASPPSDADLLARIATDLLADHRLEVTTELILGHVSAVVPGAQHASLTRRLGDRRYETLASSSPTAQKADDAQYELHEGPCVDSASGAEWFTSPEVGEDTRWPAWGRRADGLGIRSLMSVRLGSTGEPVGALNLYSAMRAAFEDPEVVDLGLLFAAHAANALSAAMLVEGLETALGSRHEIGLAQGILMERFGLDAPRSFAFLQRLSSTQEMKVRDVAHHLVHTGDLPTRRDG